jgi:alpha-1,2-mannosyltransferase
MLLGQLVAMSTVSSVFLVHHFSLPSYKDRRTSAGLFFPICILGAMVSVIYTPWAISHSKFFPNLLIMHSLVLVPLCHPSSATKRTDEAHPGAVATLRSSLKPIYYTAALVSLVVHTHNTLAVLHLLPPGKHIISFLVETLFHHPAQSSISLDAVCIHVIWMSWIIIDYFSSRGPKTIISVLSVTFISLASPVVSIGTVTPLYLAFREDWEDTETQMPSVVKAE